jgi:phosphatidylserine decarboxylase
MAPTIRYRDRETGELKTEAVFGERELRFFYESGLGRRLTDWVFSRPGGVSRLYGWLNRTAGSKAKIADYVRRLEIDPSEAALPLEDYPTLDAFFTRHLKPGARPIDPCVDHLLAPADGRTLVFPEVPAAGIEVKRSRVTLDDLLADPVLSYDLRGGSAVVIRLAPADYHRFHFPADGVASAWRQVGRTLHSVHPIALGGGAPSFLNKRAITLLETERFGRVVIVEVGALVVGTIVQTYRPGPVARGQEKGTFRFGGSTVVMVTEPGAVEWDPDLVEASAQGLESYTKMGTRVGLAPAPPAEEA